MKTLAQREGVIVFATVRDLTKAKDLEEISAKYSGKVYIIKLSACDEGEHAAAVQYIQNTTGRLDVVISNAGGFIEQSFDISIAYGLLRYLQQL